MIVKTSCISDHGIFQTIVYSNTKLRMLAIQFPHVTRVVGAMWGIVRILCPKGESFALSIVQIATYAQEG